MPAASERRPLVSLCIPTFNRRDYLRECIQSVRSQTYRPIEIVVSDNGSTDGTREMLAGMDDLVVRLQANNIGMVRNWNSVVGVASGEYCVLLSDDDILLPDFVETMVAALADTTVEFAYTPVTIIDGAGAVAGTSPAAPQEESGRDFVAATLSQQRVPYPSAIMFRRESALAIGLFEDIGNQTDVAFRIALAELRPQGRISCHPHPLVKYRIHASSLTDDPAKRVEGRVNFQRWIAGRYGCGVVQGRLAVFDLLNLQAKGVAMPPVDGPLVAAADGWFGRRLRLLSARARPSRRLLFSMFPLLLLQHALRLFNNRTFHKRYVP